MSDCFICAGPTAEEDGVPYCLGDCQDAPDGDNCNCEHAVHFPDHELYDPNEHAYLAVPASEGCVAYFVGDVCKHCATTHMATMMVREGTDEELSEVWYSITLSPPE